MKKSELLEKKIQELQKRHKELMAKCEELGNDYQANSILREAMKVNTECMKLIQEFLYVSMEEIVYGDSDTAEPVEPVAPVEVVEAVEPVDVTVFDKDWGKEVYVKTVNDLFRYLESKNYRNRLSRL